MHRTKAATIFSKVDPDKRLFMLMLVVVIAITADSQIGYIADFIPEQLSSSGGVFVFILIAVIFVVTQYFILDYVKQLNKETRQRVPHLSKLHLGISVAQYSLAGVITIIILQILLHSAVQYYTALYRICHRLWIMDCDFGAFS